MCSNLGSGSGGGAKGTMHSSDKTKAISVLQGNRGVAAFDNNGKLIGVTNKTEKNGALRLSDDRLLTADTLLFTTGRKDAKNAVVPSQRYSELFANSQAKTMEVVGKDITYTITKGNNFDSSGFKKYSAKAHSTAQQDLKRKSQIINKAKNDGKMSNEEALKQVKKANKEYSEQINNFYKDKKAQKRYGFEVTH